MIGFYRVEISLSIFTIVKFFFLLIYILYIPTNYYLLIASDNKLAVQKIILVTLFSTVTYFSLSGIFAGIGDLLNIPVNYLYDLNYPNLLVLLCNLIIIGLHKNNFIDFKKEFKDFKDADIIGLVKTEVIEVQEFLALYVSEPEYLPAVGEIEIGLQHQNNSVRTVYELRKNEWLAKMEDKILTEKLKNK